MRGTRRLAVGLLCLSLGLPALSSRPAAAEEDAVVRVRTGDHPTFGRVVFDFPGRVSYKLTRDGDRVRLRFEGAGRIGSVPSRARNIQRITGGEGQADLVVSPETTIHPWRMGNGIVIDVLDPGPDAAAGAGSPSEAPASRPQPDKSTAPAPAAEHPADVASVPADQPSRAASTQRLAIPEPTAAPVSVAKPIGVVSRQELPRPEAATEVAPRSTSSDAAPPALAGQSAPGQSAPGQPSQDFRRDDPARLSTAAAGPLALAVTRVAPPAGVVGSAISLPFGSGAGLAAFRRGDTVLLVFDEARPLDVAALRGDRIFGSATVQLLPTATVIRLHPPPGTELALARASSGWTVSAGTAANAVEAIEPVLTDRHLDFPTPAAGAVVSVSDPETGGLMLVGTLRQPGQGVPVARRTSEFVLLPTWQGIAVEPLSDKVLLRVLQSGFRLGAAPAGLALAASPPDAAA
jgi:hypothetical protein